MYLHLSLLFSYSALEGYIAPCFTSSTVGLHAECRILCCMWSGSWLDNPSWPGNVYRS